MSGIKSNKYFEECPDPKIAHTFAMPNELKPCPFCGSEARLFSFCEGVYDETKLKHNVQCLNEKDCFARVGRDWAFGYETKEEAIEAWNRRVENDQQR